MEEKEINSLLDLTELGNLPLSQKRGIMDRLSTAQIDAWCSCGAHAQWQA